MNVKATTLVIAVIAIIIGATSAFTVDETEQVVITRFNKVQRVVSESGLHFKMPFFIDHAVYYPRNLQEWDGDPDQIPTKEKRYIRVDSFARWKIKDPVMFFKTIGVDLRMATLRLNEIIDPAVRDMITSNLLIETVRNTNRELDTFEVGIDDIKDKQLVGFDQAPSMHKVTVGRNKISEMILAEASSKLVQFGIELVDVKLKRIDYVEEVRQSVYQRMTAERKQIAEKFRSEGQGEARKIMGDKELDLQRIRSGAYRRSQEIKGIADAQATLIYAEAFGKDPDFYEFTKAMEIYNEAFDKSSSLVLSTNSELFRYLKGVEKQ